MTGTVESSNHSPKGAAFRAASSRRFRVDVSDDRISMRVKLSDPFEHPRWRRIFFHIAVMLAFGAAFTTHPDNCLLTLATFFFIPTLLYTSLVEAVWRVARDGPVHRIARRSIEIDHQAPASDYRRPNGSPVLKIDGRPVEVPNSCKVVVTSSEESTNPLEMSCDPSGVYIAFDDHVIWVETFDRLRDAEDFGEMLAAALGADLANASSLGLYPWPHPRDLLFKVLVAGMVEWLAMTMCMIVVADKLHGTTTRLVLAGACLAFDAIVRHLLGRKLRDRVSERTRTAFGL